LSCLLLYINVADCDLALQYKRPRESSHSLKNAAKSNEPYKDLQPGKIKAVPSILY